MDETLQHLRQRIQRLLESFDGQDETPINEMLALVESLPKKEVDFFKDNPIRAKIKFHWKIFPYLAVHTQINNLHRLIPFAGRSAKPNQEIVKIILKLLNRASDREQKEIWNCLPGWLSSAALAEKDTILDTLREKFNQNFLHADQYYETHCSEYISSQEYQWEKSKFVTTWVKQNFRMELDSEQATAIGTTSDHVQVIARAGSGKTRTLVNRALFLQQHCGILPHEMMLLAFNRKAVEDIQYRLKEHLQEAIPHVMTFHALAYALVHPESMLFDEPEGEQSKSRALQATIDAYLHDPDYYQEIRALMTAHFRKDWEHIISGGYHRSPKELLSYRRSLPREGIDGTYLKSFGEKVIANFLFEHNISYKYERNFFWNGINYHPDFTVYTGANQGVIIEYFGLEGDPDYDALSHKKRSFWEQNPQWQLIELSPTLLRKGKIEEFHALLKRSLEGEGICCDRLSEEEIWRRIKGRAIDRFTKVVVSFIQRCRKLSLSPDALATIVSTYKPTTEVEQRFLLLVQKFYISYLKYLQETGEEDFDGMLQKAAKIVSTGQTTFRCKSGSGDLRNLRYILIDEYQDFSGLFYSLIKAVQQQNPQVHFFCVGDDWQAINGFAGSDLRFYRDFEQIFQPACKLNISTNYRSAASIVEVGNKLMHGFGLPARPSKQALGLITIVNLETFEPTAKEETEHSGDNITPAVLRLVYKAIKDGSRVVLLSRKNNLPWYVNGKKLQEISTNGALDCFLEIVRSYLPEDYRDKVTISTAHKYKGLEKSTVIILDAIPRCYPLIHPDLIFTQVLGDCLEKVVEEERRLFYVAITRAVEQLFIFTENSNPSPFLNTLNIGKSIPVLDWNDYPVPHEQATRIIVQVGNHLQNRGKGTYAIKDLLKAEGYTWCKNSTKWKNWWHDYPIDDFLIQEPNQGSPFEKFLSKSLWATEADGVEVRFYDDLGNKLAIYQLNKARWTDISEKKLS